LVTTRNKNTIAVCIPAYNAAWCLPRLLQSILDQHIQFDEILVYNDCSTDQTEFIAKSYGAKVINGKTNKGCSFGKNVLINETSCEWIHFHDADDELLPNFTSLAQQWIKQIDCPDVVLFNYNYVNNTNKELITTRKFDQESLSKDAIAYSLKEQINPFCGLYRKSAIIANGGYNLDPKLLYAEDSAFHIKMAIAGLSFSSEKEISIINYAVEGSMSAANKKKCIISQFHVLVDSKDQLEKLGSLDPYRKLLSNLLFEKALFLATCKAWKELDYCLLISRNLDYSQKILFKNQLLNNLFNSYPKIMFRIRAWYNSKKNKQYAR
jgi:glycosyltransferase involved in cell wall biosynthesis